MKKYKFKTFDGNWMHKVKVARLIIEEQLERKLSSNEVVHHINGDKSDDKIENLQVMLKKEHDRLHAKELRFSPPKDSLAYCGACKKFLLRSCFGKHIRHWNGLDDKCKPCKSIYRKEYYARGITQSKEKMQRQRLGLG